MYINVTAKAQSVFRFYPQVADPEAAKAQALANPLYSWHATYFSVQHHRQVAFINDAADLLVILPNVYSHDYRRLQKLFEDQLSDQLHRLGLTSRQIHQYLKQAGPWQINRTINRQIVGNLTQAIRDNKPLIGGQGRETLAGLAQQIRQAVKADNSLVETVIFSDLPAWQKGTAKGQQAAGGNRRLQNVANQLRYLEDHRSKIKEEDYDKTVARISELNQVLIKAFVAANPAELSAKTLHRHQSRLEFFLNSVVAYQLGTIYGPLVTDLEEPLAHGATINEMRQVRTALKKFFQYLNEQGVLSNDDLQKDKEELRYQLVDQSMEEHNIWDNLDFASFFNPPQLTLPLFDADTEQVLASYCAACANLYGVISCDQAYRIIMKQNPQLPVGPHRLADWFEAHRGDQATSFTIDEIGGDGSIIHPAIYRQDLQQRLLTDQLGLPFYLPNKEQLLKYRFSAYQEDGLAVRKYQQSLVEDVHVPREETLKWTARVRRLFNDQFNRSFTDNQADLEREMAAEGYTWDSPTARQRWHAALAALLPDLRLFVNRGLTLPEREQRLAVIEEVKRHKGLTPAVVAEIKAARFDPLDIIIGTTFLDGLTEEEKTAIVDQLSALDIPTLG
ncbi:MAG: DUF6933 domain-containing protein [Limosilactobacillus oris]